MNFDPGKIMPNISAENASKLEKIASSSDGQKVKTMLDGMDITSAVENGDTEAMRRALAGILGTEEGKRLCSGLSDILR